MGQEGSKQYRGDSTGSRSSVENGGDRASQRVLQDPFLVDDAPGAVVVVQQSTAASTPTRMDAPEIRALQEIPAFTPLLRESLQLNWLANSTGEQSLARLDPVMPAVVCGRLQRHVTVCAQLVQREQEMLSDYVTAVEESTVTAVSSLADTLQRVTKCTAQLQEVAAVARTLQSIQASVHRSLSAMQSLNDMLPEAERLETFRWHSPPPNKLAAYSTQ